MASVVKLNKTVGGLTSSAQFFYGTGRGRYKQIAITPAGQSGQVMPAGTETTLYIGGLFEKVTKPSGVIESRHYILAGKDAIAIKTQRSSAVNDVRCQRAFKIDPHQAFKIDPGWGSFRFLNR